MSKILSYEEKLQWCRSRGVDPLDLQLGPPPSDHFCWFQGLGKAEISLHFYRNILDEYQSHGLIEFQSSVFDYSYQRSMLHRVIGTTPDGKLPSDVEFDATERDAITLILHLLTIFWWDANFIDYQGRFVLSTYHHQTVRFFSHDKALYDDFVSSIRGGFEIVHEGS